MIICQSLLHAAAIAQPAPRPPSGPSPRFPPPATHESITTETSDGAGEIIIVGERPEQHREDRPGQSLVARPAQPTRYDTSSQLAGEAAVALPRSGRPAAAGFALPKIRGQDARLTDLFVDDLLVQDPYAGLPLLDDLDLRAFGELRLHQGSSPPELATVNPIGVLQLRFRPVMTPRLDVGLRSGEPYGTSAWAAAASPDVSLYARQHHSSGRYRYLDDQGTPYNASDDRYAVRRNNDRRSRQLVPRWSWRDGDHALSGFALWQDSDGGIAAGNAAAARSAQRQTLAATRYRYALTPALAADVTAALVDDRRQLHDPGGQLLQRGEDSTQALRTQRYAAGVSWQHAAISSRAQITSARTDASNTDAGDTDAGDTDAGDTAASGTANDNTSRLSRDALAGYLGVAVRPAPGLVTELKTELRRHADRATAARDQLLPETEATNTIQPSIKSERWTRGVAAAVGYAVASGDAAASSMDGLFAARTTLYAQIARVERAPSLLEELGDGADVRPSPDLAAERVRHLELGVSTRLGPAALRLASFRDETQDRIVIIRSLAATSRAENLRSTVVNGLDAGIDASTRLWLGRTRGALNLCRLAAEDRSDPDSTRQVPGVPRWRGVLLLEQGFGAAITARWLSRYQDASYRDPLNDIVIPGYLLHDASVDAVAGGYGIGLALINVFDVTTLPIAARDGRHGQTALSDLWGEPLPGRHWSLSVSASF